MSRSSSSGQASVEYVALLALLAAALAAAAGVTVVGAPGTVNAVVGQIRHALCLVGGGECRQLEPQACVMRSDRRTDGWTVSVVVARLDHEHVLLRETLSDGTVRLTRVRHVGGGAAVSAPTSAELRLGATAVGVGGSASAELLLVAGRGRVWHATSTREADRIAAALARGDGPEPDEVYLEGGLEAGLGLDVVLGVGGGRGVRGRGPGGAGTAGGGGDRGRAAADEAGAGVLPETRAESAGRLVLGRREDRRTGETAYLVRFDGEAQAVFEWRDAGVRGASATTAVAEVLVGPDGEPRELVVSASAALAGRGAVPGVGEVRGGRRWEGTARADLRDPELRAAFAAWRARPGDRRAARALAATLAERAHLETRVYARTTTGDRGGVGARLGVEVGAEWRDEQQRERLERAADRPPSGLWEPRLDCVAAA